MSTPKMNSEIGRTTIDEKVKLKLWAVSGGRCELCNRLLYSDLCFGADGNFGELAHIHAVSVGGPRHKKGMSTNEKNDAGNLMLLCGEHHHMIDTNPDDYGEGFLIERKRKHEERIRRVTHIGEDQSCQMVSYFSNIDQQVIFNSDRLFKDAILSVGLLPLQQPVINLHNDSHLKYEPTKENIEAKAKDMDLQFRIWFDTAVKSSDAIAIFSLAPQPLLFKLGTLFNDQYNTQVFQCHRSGHKWAWKGDSSDIEYFIRQTSHNDGGKEALVMDLSAEIIDDRITNVLGDECTITHLTIDNPNRLFVTNRSIQDSFVISFRKAIESIKNNRPRPKELHVFMAMPNSLAVRAGMDYMPKTDLPVVLYEQGSADQGFFETIRIGG